MDVNDLLLNVNHIIATDRQITNYVNVIEWYIAAHNEGR